MATSTSIIGTVKLDVILRPHGQTGGEHVVGEVTVPVKAHPVSGERTVLPADMERALAALAAPAARTRAGRRRALRSVK